MLRSLLPSAWLPLEEIIKEAKAEAFDITERWDVPKIAFLAADLHDKLPRLFGLRSGHRIAGRMLPEDAQVGFLSASTPILFALLPVLSVLAALGQALLGTAGLVLPLIAAAGVIVVISNITSRMWTILAAVFGVLLPVFGVQSVGLLAQLPGSVGVMAWLFPATVVLCLAAVVINNYRLRLVAKWLAGLLLLQTISALLPAGLSQLFWIATACCLAPAYARSCMVRRWLRLEHQGNTCLLETIGPADRGYDARLKQAKNVERDLSPVIHFGDSKGVFTKRFDPFAPDPGMPMVMSLNDLSTHFVCFGTTGAGKSNLLSIIAWNYFKSKMGGMLVLDGKGVLPAIFTNWPGYRIIRPKVSTLALVEGLSPNEIRDAIYQVFNVQGDVTNSGTSNHGFFVSSASTMLFHAAVFLDALVRSEKIRETLLKEKKQHEIAEGEVEPSAEADEPFEVQWRWTYSEIGKVAAFIQQDITEDIKSLENAVTVVKNALAHEVAQPGRFNIADTLTYIRSIPGMPKDTRGGIYQTLCSWLRPITENEDLKPWASAETGVDPTDCLRGAAIGILVPTAQYGQAGKVIQALVKARVTTKLRLRGPEEEPGKMSPWKIRGEKTVAILVDEAQEIGVGEADQVMTQQGRSMGCICIYATQSIEEFEKKLGEVGTRAFLSNFRSRATFTTSAKTMAWFQEQLGTSWSLIFGSRGVAIDYRNGWKMLAQSPLADPHHPARKFYNRRRRLGAGTFAEDIGQRAPIALPNGGTAGASSGYDMESNLTLAVARGGEWKMQPIFIDADAADLKEPYVAVIEVMRGGVPRRDLCAIAKFEEPQSVDNTGNASEVGSKADSVASKPSSTGGVK
ncbi:MAG: DUF87 domain-containing protein [Rudaea sp.]|nr:DUF87 domain-containing protein [Rudaea sp.]